MFLKLYRLFVAQINLTNPEVTYNRRESETQEANSYLIVNINYV